ncbi:hypothetical protein BUPH_08329 (plasmid) [Paraburkholderia phenoliruptrix BR3459a]|uniref:Uncharacterized protein n=1 Tax=Paraburkholderia phenoliruptrix BR3459a TaxID=1229205 RepID=K0DZF0_9BURK|nr:hypothetical protein BUPH_08329 [Paraburkholderia phenoliruptrix BR3459a]
MRCHGTSNLWNDAFLRAGNSSRPRSSGTSGSTLACYLSVMLSVMSVKARQRLLCQAVASRLAPPPSPPSPPCPLIGHCEHWGVLNALSAMWRTADGGGIEQRDGSFLH